MKGLNPLAVQQYAVNSMLLLRIGRSLCSPKKKKSQGAQRQLEEKYKGLFIFDAADEETETDFAGEIVGILWQEAIVVQREKVTAGWRAEVKELDTTKSLPQADSGSEAVLYVIYALIPLILESEHNSTSSQSTLETSELVVVVVVLLHDHGGRGSGRS